MPIEGDDEVARLSHGVQRDAGRPRRVPRAAAPAGRRRRPRAAHPADLAAHQPRPAHPGRRADGGPDPGPQARAELLDDIRAQIEELTTLIGDLAELARERAADPVVETSRPERGAGPRARPGTPPGTGRHVRRRCRSPWWVVGEATALERAITNLLDNAAKWSPPDGTVTVRLVRRRADRGRRGPGHQRGGPAARLRALLAGRGVADHARLRPGPVDRGAGRRAARRAGRDRYARPPAAPGSIAHRSRVRGRRMRDRRTAAWVARARAAAAGSPAAATTTDRHRPLRRRRRRCGTRATPWTRRASSRAFGVSATEDAGTRDLAVVLLHAEDRGRPGRRRQLRARSPRAWTPLRRPWAAPRPRRSPLRRCPAPTTPGWSSTPTTQQLYVSGFVQNGDLIQTVDAVDPKPFDRRRVVGAVTWALGELSAHAPESGVS